MQNRALVLLILLVAVLPLLAASAAPTSSTVEAGQRLAAAEQRISELQSRLVSVAVTADSAHTAIARELAQPMLLLVGRGPCPSGFKRIVTRVLILTRARNAENGHLWDEAGLTYEDPPGVGDNVYRDLDFCFRPANSVTID